MLISDAQIADLRRQVGPGLGDEIGEIWRLPVNADGVVPGGSGVGKYGTRLTGGVDVGRLDQKSVKVAGYYCQKFENSNQSLGVIRDDALQGITLAPWTIVFNAADAPDIGPADVIKLAAKRELSMTPAQVGWRKLQVYENGDDEQPVISSGLYYRCTVTGRTGATEPTWPATLNATVNDGSVTWKCMGPLQTFEIINPGAPDSIYIERLVGCRELRSH